MRVVSLLPAATEIVGALGLADRLVAVSHECDHPPEVATLPRATRCPIHGNALASDAIDHWVTDTLARTGTLYSLDEALVRALQPDAILTQRLCDVCAVGYETVSAFAATLPGPPRVVNLEPTTLAGVLDDVRTIAAALGAPERGTRLVAALEARIDAVRARVAGARARRCVVLEWIAPPYRSGHWTPELVALAGGIEPLGRAGEDAARVAWDDVVQAAPEVVVLACCGFDVARTLRDVPLLRSAPGWDHIPAVADGDVWVVDGSAYMSRPGPRVVDSLEMLAAILHPGRCASSVPETACRRLGCAELAPIPRRA
jgi:iron complex transport system substrate-binding protein